MTTPPRRRSESEVGKQLTQARESLGWSLRQAERESGVSNSYISQIERGDVEPSPDVLRRLGAACTALTQTKLTAARETEGYLALLRATARDAQ